MFCHHHRSDRWAIAFLLHLQHLSGIGGFDAGLDLCGVWGCHRLTFQNLPTSVVGGWSLTPTAAGWSTLPRRAD
jgi:hypothetical protein